ncbi:MAG: hypothetical protein H6559_19350 [Lewinellaceae bacterium]|nr:hypothetical protein [Lewinellaceae bacterium]
MNGIESTRNFQFADTITTGYFQSCFSPDGKKYARIDIKYLGESEHRVTVYDFDRCTGEFTSFTSFTFVDWALGGGGIAFSENSRFLYVIAWLNIYQFDLTSSNVGATLLKVAEYDGFVTPINNQSTPFRTAQSTPNGEIFVNCASNANYFHIIQSPNQKGLACNAQQHALEIPTFNFNSIPTSPTTAWAP